VQRGPPGVRVALPGEAEKYYRYPEFWKLTQPQPAELVPITVEGTSWNYVIGNQRYGSRG